MRTSDPARRLCEITPLAFTLAELLVVIAVLGILAALALPALSKAEQRAQGIRCINNYKQLMIALHLYTADFSDWLPPNLEDGSDAVWVRGYMNDAWEATNTVYLTDPRSAKLAPYTGSAASLYKCPADRSRHARTVSMNQAVGCNPGPPLRPVDGPWLDGTRRHKANHPWRTYGKFSDMTKPGPSSLWILTDENAISINDAAFALSMETPTEWIDWPGAYHAFGCTLAFGDGHVEIHHWTDRRTKMDSGANSGTLQPKNADIMWLQQRTSAKVPAYQQSSR